MSKDPAYVSPTARAITLIVVELVVLGLVLAAIFYLTPVIIGEREVDASPVAAEPVEEPEPEPEPAEPAEPEVEDIVPSERSMIATHTVRRGDTLWDLAEEYWGNRHLWPDLYIHNENGVDDPDELTVGSTLEIPETLLSNNSIGPTAMNYLIDGYVSAYRAYRRRSETLLRQARASGRDDLRRRSRVKLAKAQWLLYSGTRFDLEFLATRIADIHADDYGVVRAYLERFGRPAISE